MERSVKFMSISGVAGILAGTFALVGAAATWKILYNFDDGPVHNSSPNESGIVVAQVLIIAVSVLILSLGTGILMSVRKARRLQQHIWNPASRLLLMMVAIPLIAGGLISLILLSRGFYALIAPSLLIFYGLALVAGSPYTFREIRWLGLIEVVLGLLAALLPECGLLLWTIGFGVLHIVYGSIMYYKYEK